MEEEVEGREEEGEDIRGGEEKERPEKMRAKGIRPCVLAFHHIKLTSTKLFASCEHSVAVA